MSDERLNNIIGIFNILIRRLRLVKVQRNILVFFVFLLIAIIFWFMQAMQETTTTQLTFNLQITNIPKEVIFTSDVPKTVNISVTGRGWAILEYWSKHDNKEIIADFKDIEKSNSRLTLDNNLWRRLTQKFFGNNLKFVAANPSDLDIYYSNGIAKRVPVKFDGHINTASQYMLCSTEITPDSVDVIAPAYLLDSIKEVSTTSEKITNLDDTLRKKIPIKASAGIKVVPDSVSLTVCVDLFTEKTLEVPIYCENIPANKVLRTFPSKATVTFHVSSAMFNKISTQDFIVVVDYNQLSSENTKCDLILRAQPRNISHVRISPEQIEYVIEQAFE